MYAVVTMKSMSLCRRCGRHDEQPLHATITEETGGQDHGAGTGGRPEGSAENETEEGWLGRWSAKQEEEEEGTR